ncbi:branched-chain alpha-keto acid dehydrogenase subunit E2 [Tardibacter chloracetimidivorans]|uniref:Dihydrolipoamide acetyltransferase component of pyruvate dehydrogenase complex n=1 Tax=Tardibacter chloracetimidivorans TaxID=1921510 RepID=A0A1L3ZT27_9SPHN|nr:dihydrolipoamide acetyltransferase family protein [Tardibacter chloracetimidivorans]API58793.1 branched-chain alpha-keto acid dehydrogenase subunit E2 [Tardibacter chloracetimidivorans]
MARFEFKLPDIGEGIAEAEVVAWHVKPGDVVEEDAPLADMMTDKATVELSAPVGGKVIEINGKVGETVAIGSVLAVFETDGEAAETEAEEEATPPQATAPEKAPREEVQAESTARKGRVLASPAVRKRALDLGVDLALVRPAEGGRVRHGDLDSYLRYSSRSGGAAERSAPDRVEEVKVVGLRRRIADNMAESKRHIPHFSYVEESDVTALEALRGEMNANRGDRPKLTLLPFLIKAIAGAIPGFPMVNARYDDEAGVVRRHSAVHLGLATQTDAGLMVPVIRDAASRSVWNIAAEIARLSDGARAGKLSRDDLSGSTITLTSLGALGGIVSTPVINRPEVAIVGVNRIVERPAVIDGRVEIRKLMNLSSSFDHRVVDGYDAARFIQAVKRLIETPALVFVDQD